MPLTQPALQGLHVPGDRGWRSGAGAAREDGIRGLGACDGGVGVTRGRGRWIRGGSGGGLGTGDGDGGGAVLRLDQGLDRRPAEGAGLALGGAAGAAAGGDHVDALVHCGHARLGVGLRVVGADAAGPVCAWEAVGPSALARPCAWAVRSGGRPLDGAWHAQQHGLGGCSRR